MPLQTRQCHHGNHPRSIYVLGTGAEHHRVVVSLSSHKSTKPARHRKSAHSLPDCPLRPRPNNCVPVQTPLPGLPLLPRSLPREPHPCFPVRRHRLVGPARGWSSCQSPAKACSVWRSPGKPVRARTSVVYKLRPPPVPRFHFGKKIVI